MVIGPLGLALNELDLGPASGPDIELEEVLVLLNDSINLPLQIRFTEKTN